MEGPVRARRELEFANELGRNGLQGAARRFPWNDDRTDLSS